MGENLAELLNERYKVAARFLGLGSPGETTAINRAIYTALSRESHAKIRIEPHELRIDSDGYVEVSPRARDSDFDRELAAGALSTTLFDAILGLQYRMARRKIESVQQVSAQTRRAPPPPVPPGFATDLGLMILESGTGAAQLHFPGVCLRQIATLPDGTISASATAGAGPERSLATFDFKGRHATTLLSLLPNRFADELRAAAAAGEIHSILLPRPLTMDLEAVLGTLQTTGEEAFVPLIVVEVRSAPGT